MENETTTRQLASNLGMSSLVIGIIGLFLFFLPVLGIPLSLFGLAFGVLGSAVGFFAKGPAIRWGLGGVGTSILALAVNLGIANAPGANVPGSNIPKSWQPVPGTPYVPPPALPGFTASPASVPPRWRRERCHSCRASFFAETKNIIRGWCL